MKKIKKLAILKNFITKMIDEDDHDEQVRCTGSDVEIEEYTDTEEPAYTTYQSTDKLFDTEQPCWQRFSFLATLGIVTASVTTSIISLPLYLENVSGTANAYTGTQFLPCYVALYTLRSALNTKHSVCCIRETILHTII